MNILLLYPPITDPTSGYHPLCYLATHAKKSGYDCVDIVDTNIEALNYSMREDEISYLKTHIETRLGFLGSLKQLTNLQEHELLYLRKSRSFDFEGLERGVTCLKNETSFLDYKRYSESVKILSKWPEVLSVLGIPGQFRGYSLNHASRFSVMSSSDLCNLELLMSILRPFQHYFELEFFPRLAKKNYDVIGVNITYIDQLPFALALGHEIRTKFPHVKLIFGGTEVSDVWKYSSHKDLLFQIFHMADACVIGEGESAFVSFLDCCSEGKFRPIPNCKFNPIYGSLSDIIMPIKYEDLRDLHTPDYSDLIRNNYFSPYPFVYYSPSRGCYWNKCTFCDYGLNGDSPTSPWRQRSLEQVVKDLTEISIKIKYIYFSVDVLAPSMLLKLAERIIEEKIEIRWSAEIRLETYWSTDKCKILKDGGCVCISVGFESGNQRILNLIDKGTEVNQVLETITHFKEVGIAVQMMAFTGFPTESFEEAMDSVRFLEDYRDLWTFGGLGEFVLTRGAIVAKRPQDFGLKEVTPYKGQDIWWELYYKEDNLLTDEQINQLRDRKNALDVIDFDRPWLGGVDTPHTIFYCDKYGDKVLEEINMATQDSIAIDISLPYLLNGKVELNEQLSSHRLYSDQDMKSLHTLYRENGTRLDAAVIDNLVNEQQAYGDVHGQEVALVFFRSDFKMLMFTRYSDEVERLCSWFVEPSSMKDFLDKHDIKNREIYTGLWKQLVKSKILLPCDLYYKTKDNADVGHSN